MEYFRNKLVWVTGASSGIGEQFAHQLNKAGAKVIISARNLSKLEKVKASVLHPEQMFVEQLDMENFDEIRKVSNKVKNEYGIVDMLFCNAGMSQRSLAKNTDFSVDQRMITLNLLSHILHAKSVLPGMLSKNAGHFIVISSLAGKMGLPLRTGYAASKHGLHGFFDSLRIEEENSGIQVSIITPGYINTDIAINALTGSGVRNGTNETSMKNAMSPQELVEKSLRKISRGQKEILLGGFETYGVTIKRFFPNLIHRIVKRKKF